MKTLAIILLISILQLNCNNQFERPEIVYTNNLSKDFCKKKLLGMVLTPNLVENKLKIINCNRKLFKTETIGWIRDSIILIETGEGLGFIDEHYGVKYTLKSISKSTAKFNYDMKGHSFDRGEFDVSIIGQKEEPYLSYLDNRISKELAIESVKNGSVFVFDTFLNFFGYEGEISAKRECLNSFKERNEFSIYTAYGCKLTDYNRQQLNDFNSVVFEHLKLKRFSFGLLENYKKELYNCEF